MEKIPLHQEKAGNPAKFRLEWEEPAQKKFQSILQVTNPVVFKRQLINIQEFISKMEHRFLEQIGSRPFIQTIGKISTYELTPLTMEEVNLRNLEEKKIKAFHITTKILSAIQDLD
jgi:hypothetical protein